MKGRADYARLTRTAGHVALDSDLTFNIGLHKNSLQHLASRGETGNILTFHSKMLLLV